MRLFISCMSSRYRANNVHSAKNVQNNGVLTLPDTETDTGMDKNGLFRIMRRCSYCAETDINSLFRIMRRCSYCAETDINSLFRIMRRCSYCAETDINSLFRIMRRCSYCAETDINTDSHSVNLSASVPRINTEKLRFFLINKKRQIYFAADMSCSRMIFIQSLSCEALYAARYSRRSFLKFVSESPWIALSSVSLGNTGLIQILWVKVIK